MRLLVEGIEEALNTVGALRLSPRTRASAHHSIPQPLLLHAQQQMNQQQATAANFGAQAAPQVQQPGAARPGSPNLRNL